ncbi:DNA repair protein RecO [Gynurincola endophyticus]|uniref:DNA repair protein RecO n=1 Tax=Gynurincola endophyticus TaxID=2479004 RepID=UPI000F8D08A1|nr:DNA repair protein RecO [Gynurincola endophyticus]
MSLFKTKGIVLRSTKYGETSVITSIYTELFGVQSYLINGVRVEQKKASSKANLLQPAAILDLVVYHQEQKNLQRVKDLKWDHLYQNIYFNIIKNAAALFAIELLQKTLKQPEANPELFYFIENSFISLDEGDEWITANFPIFFALHLMHHYGFSLLHQEGNPQQYFDLAEAQFVEEHPIHPQFIAPPITQYLLQILDTDAVEKIGAVKMSKEVRGYLLQSIQQFYQIHFSDFGTLKTLPILKEVLS